MHLLAAVVSIEILKKNHIFFDQRGKKTVDLHTLFLVRFGIHKGDQVNTSRALDIEGGIAIAEELNLVMLPAALDPVVDEILDRAGHRSDHVGIVDLVPSQVCFADEQAALFMDNKKGRDQRFSTLFEKEFCLADAGYFGFDFSFIAFKGETFIDFIIDRLHQFADGRSDIFADHSSHNGIERIDHRILVGGDLFLDGRCEYALKGTAECFRIVFRCFCDNIGKIIRKYRYCFAVFALEPLEQYVVKQGKDFRCDMRFVIRLEGQIPEFCLQLFKLFKLVTEKKLSEPLELRIIFLQLLFPQYPQ